MFLSLLVECPVRSGNWQFFSTISLRHWFCSSFLLSFPFISLSFCGCFPVFFRLSLLSIYIDVYLLFELKPLKVSYIKPLSLSLSLSKLLYSYCRQKYKNVIKLAHLIKLVKLPSLGIRQQGSLCALILPNSIRLCFLPFAWSFCEPLFQATKSSFPTPTILSSFKYYWNETWNIWFWCIWYCNIEYYTGVYLVFLLLSIIVYDSFQVFIIRPLLFCIFFFICVPHFCTEYRFQFDPQPTHLVTYLLDH